MIDIEVEISLLESRLAPLDVRGIRRLTGGASSLSYAATAQIEGVTRRIVVKVAPPGLAPVRNRDVLRQASVMRQLASTDVPVPAVLWEDPGAPPEVPPIFVMSFVDGASFEPLFDTGGKDDPRVVADRMVDAAGVLARLHGTDPAVLGLAREPVVSLAQEVSHWARALETVDAMLVPGWEDVASALTASQPASMRASVLHGDFRLGNLLADGPTVTAVIDWEIWAIGDPRVDLGWFLANADPDTYGRNTRYAGLLPTPQALTDRYAEQLGQAVPAMSWFVALACFKSAATWSLIVKHSRRRPSPDPTAEEMAGALPELLHRAVRLLQGDPYS